MSFLHYNFCFDDLQYYMGYSIYGKTLSMLLEFIENYLVACYDAVGILLMIRVSVTNTIFVPTFSNWIYVR